MEAESGSCPEAFSKTQKSFDKASHPWSTHDRACTHCRERKIRCDREKPQCSNCERDGVECGYHPPGKRVNHIKLLCNNVGGLEDRLRIIETGLLRLTSLLAADDAPSPLTSGFTVEGSTSTQAFPPDHINGRAPPPSSSYSLVRNQADHTDRYHGPITPLSLCREFSDTLLSGLRRDSTASIDSKTGGVSQNEMIRDTLARMCHDAGIEEPVESRANYSSTPLPPKQFLLLIIPRFFEHVDCATDIFMQSSFVGHVERVYSGRHHGSDEAWSICFNTIILLVLNSGYLTQRADLPADSQYAQPFLAAVLNAIRNPHILMTPALINIQAMTLLGLAAHRYCAPSLASSILAQACVLAKTMGLHQLHTLTAAYGSDELIERLRVARSLYVCDKSFSILRGSVCWLPTSDFTLPFDLERDALGRAKYSARIQLAALQDEIYRLQYSADSARYSAAKRKVELARIEKNLEEWAETHRIFTSQSPTHEVALILEFLATRINALRQSSDPCHVRRSLRDARASCLLMLVAHGRLERSMLGCFEALVLSKSSSRLLANAVGTTRAKRKGPGDETPGNAINDPSCGCISIGFRRLFDFFSMPAFFLLARNVILPVSNAEVSETASDLDLLERVSACFRQLDARYQSENYVQRVGGIFAAVLQSVDLVRSDPVSPMSPDSAQQAADLPTTASPQNQLGNHQGASTCPGLSASMTYLSMGGISQDMFPMKVSLSGTSDVTMVPSQSPVLLTSMESGYFSQWDDPVRQHAYSPLFQQQAASFPSRKRLRFNDTEISVDDSTDPNPLAEFLHAAPIMPF